MCQDGKDIDFKEGVRRETEQVSLNIEGAYKHIEQLNQYLNGEIDLPERHANVWEKQLEAV